MKTYIDMVMSDWLYRPHIRERIENKIFIEDGPIVLNRLRDEEYMEIPLFGQIYCLCEFILNEGHIKLTSVGNLPQKVVFKMYSLGVPDRYYEKYPNKLKKETDSFSVHLARLLAELSGLLRKKSNSLYLTKKGEKAMNDRHLLLKTILQTFVYKLNWGYFDGYEDKMIGQEGFDLTLLLIASDGASPRLSRYYSDRYFYHFEFSGLNEYSHSCFAVRTFRTFLQNLGLISFSENKNYIDYDNCYITKTSLFDKLITIDKDYAKISYSNADAPLYRLRIGLDQSNPHIWREIIAPSNLSLENFHVVIQGVMGWSDSHLHQYIKAGIQYSVLHDVDYTYPDLEFVDYKEMNIRDLLSFTGESVKYEYDFGDGWMHTVELLEIIDEKEFLNMSTVDAGHLGDTPIFLKCLDGALNCPPENCGGIHGYLNILEILKDPFHEEYDEIIEWIGSGFDPEFFDLKSVNAKLATFCKR